MGGLEAKIMIFVKSEYLGVKESRIIPTLPSGMDIPPPKEAHDEYRGPSGDIENIRLIENAISSK